MTTGATAIVAFLLAHRGTRAIIAHAVGTWRLTVEEGELENAWTAAGGPCYVATSCAWMGLESWEIRLLDRQICFERTLPSGEAAQTVLYLPDVPNDDWIALGQAVMEAA